MNPEAPSPIDPITKANMSPEPASPQTAPVAPPAAISPAPQAVPVAEPPIDAAWHSPLKQIRTYQGDIAEAIQSEHASIASIRAAEKARQDLLKSHTAEEARPAPAPDPEHRALVRRRVLSVVFFIGGLIFIAAAGVGGYYAYGAYKQKTAVPVTTVPDNRFLAVASTQNADASVLSRDALVALMNTERNKPLAAGSIEQVELRKGGTDAAALTTPTEFLLLAGAKPPGNLVRALDPLFMIGVIGLPVQAAPAAVLPVATSTASSTPAVAASSTATSSSPDVALPASEKDATFILYKLDSFDNAYAGMLDWEKNLADDLLPFFHNSETVASVPSNAAWQDVTIRNKDARKLADASGKTELIYSFYNQNLLIITANEDALRSILTALDTQALAR
jgi:hypothetical protein